MTIRHVVVWSVTGDDDRARAENAHGIAERLRSLEGVVPSIRALSAGPNVAYAEVNADVALVADFDDVAGLDEYQRHPAHLEVAGFIRSVASARMAVDLEV